MNLKTPWLYKFYISSLKFIFIGKSLYYPNLNSLMSISWYYSYFIGNSDISIFLKELPSINKFYLKNYIINNKISYFNKNNN